MHIYINMNVYIDMILSVCCIMPSVLHVCTYVFTCVYTCMYIHIYICIYVEI